MPIAEPCVPERRHGAKWFLGLQDNVAANLVNLDVFPMAAEGGYEFVAAQVTRNFHPRASISSRMR